MSVDQTVCQSLCLAGSKMVKKVPVLSLSILESDGGMQSCEQSQFCVINAIKKETRTWRRDCNPDLS